MAELAAIAWLPQVNNCCLPCIPLKVGCIIICILGLNIPAHCGEFYFRVPRCSQNEFQMAANVIMLPKCVIDMMLCFASIVLLFGIVFPNQSQILLYIYITYIFVAISFVHGGLTLMGIFTNPKCPFPYRNFFVPISLVECILWSYFIVVVKSYLFNENEATPDVMQQQQVLHTTP